MLLNLAIIKDKLEDMKILDARTDKSSPRRLKYPERYEDSPAIQEDILYLASAEDLAVEPNPSVHMNLICLGYPPVQYMTDEKIELICLSASATLEDVYQKIIRIFYLYNSYDEKLKDVLIHKGSLSELGKIIHDIFKTRVSAYGRYEKLLFVIPEDPMMSVTSAGYIEEDERSILYADKDFHDTLHVRGASYLTSDIYSTDIIYYNLFEHNLYIGRIMIENTEREFTDGDYALVEWAGDYLKLMLQSSRDFHFDAPRGFEDLIQKIALHQAHYADEDQSILAQVGWARHDTFLCTAITGTQDSEETILSTHTLLNNSAFYLQESFDGQYLFIRNSTLYQIIDLSVTDCPENEVLRRLRLFQKDNILHMGISAHFQDFSELPTHIRQAELMVQYACSAKKMSPVFFDKEILPSILQLIRDNALPAVYRTEGLQRLYEYDKNNHSKLVPTLACYLKNNLSISQTMQELFIARSTCIYRINRIEKIMKTNLADPDTQLYLKIIMKLSEYGTLTDQ